MGFEIGAYASKLASTRPRTIEAVTEEILDIKQRVAEDFMELGQRLCEAKELLPHGEWLPWLEQRVQFSERTAQKFMQLAREYESNPKLASGLGSEKAFALLSLPMEEREKIAAEGATMNGKTKAAADLTTREVKQIVAERKAVSGVDFAKGPSFTVDAAQAYLEARAEEDAEYRDLLQRQKLDLTEFLAFSPTRQDGIAALKRQLSARGGYDGEVYYRGSGTGWELRKLRGDYIKRSWTELWDMLAVMALQEAGRKQPEPDEDDEPPIGWRKLSDVWPEEGQLVLLSYENGIGGFQYQIARCVGGGADVYPFVDPNNDLTCDEFECFDHWIPLVERNK